RPGYNRLRSCGACASGPVELLAVRLLGSRRAARSPARGGALMQTNPMKTALAEGKVQIGTWLNLMRNPAILTLMKSAGLDYARVDMEHSSPSIETVADMAVLGRAIGLPVVVRPPEGNREWITRLLDCGVWGLHIPQVDNPTIAKAIV